MANHIIYNSDFGILAETSIPPGFSDVTNIISLDQFGSKNIGQSWIKDWINIRDAIYNYCFNLAGGLSPENWTLTEWNLLDDDEKEIVSHYLCTVLDYNLIFDYNSDPKFLNDCLEYCNENSHAARHKRFDAFQSILMFNYSLTIIYDFYENLLAYNSGTWTNSVNLIEAYIDCGIYDSALQLKTGLYDWINNEFLTTAPAPDKSTNTVLDVVNLLNDLLVNGNY